MARGKSNSTIEKVKKHIVEIGEFSKQLEKAVVSYEKDNPHEKKLHELQQERKQLIDQGIERGTVHWKDGKYMRLKYGYGAISEGKPRTKYIGTDPKKIKETQDAIERARRVDTLDAEIRETERTMEYAIEDLRFELQTIQVTLKNLIGEWQPKKGKTTPKVKTGRTSNRMSVSELLE